MYSYVSYTAYHDIHNMVVTKIVERESSVPGHNYIKNLYKKQEKITTVLTDGIKA